jgi:cytochrome c biogenesis protein CcmG, thiol:disulfide interchange protein DsbE
VSETNTSKPILTASEAAGPKRFSLLAVLPVALFGLLALGFLYSLFRSNPEQLPSVLIGKPAPKFALPAIPGVERNGVAVPGFATADLGGGKVSIVNVWASWCIPCRDEQPLLGTIAERLKVPIYGINQKDSAANAVEFLKNLGNPFEKIGADGNGRASIDWGVYGVPETYVVDGAGRIAYKYIGPLTPEAIEKELRPAVERARKGGG